jgi:molybdopterin-guanine dinucleotide biosynthesis protein B
MKVIAIVGYHNSGKTTLIEKLAEELKNRGLRVGYLKHDPKGHGETDREGSDTSRVFKVADRVALASPDRMTLWDRRDDDPLSIVREFFKGFDVVILEGYKGVGNIPKIAVGGVEAENVLLRVDGVHELGHIIELLESMEENL